MNMLVGAGFATGGLYDGHGGTLRSCWLFAVDVGAEGRGPLRGPLCSGIMLLVTTSFRPDWSPSQVNGNPAQIPIHLSFFHSLLPILASFRPLELLIAPFPGFGLFAFCSYVFPFLSTLSTARLLYTRENRNPNLWGSENAQYWGELRE